MFNGLQNDDAFPAEFQSELFRMKICFDLYFILVAPKCKSKKLKDLFKKKLVSHHRRHRIKQIHQCTSTAM